MKIDLENDLEKPGVGPSGRVGTLEYWADYEVWSTLSSWGQKLIFPQKKRNFDKNNILIRLLLVARFVLVFISHKDITSNHVSRYLKI